MQNHVADVDECMIISNSEMKLIRVANLKRWFNKRWCEIEGLKKDFLFLAERYNKQCCSCVWLSLWWRGCIFMRWKITLELGFVSDCCLLGTSYRRVITYNRSGEWTTSVGTNSEKWWSQWSCQYQGQPFTVFFTDPSSKGWLV